MINPLNKLRYRERRYKYQVMRDYTDDIGLLGYDIDTDYFRLAPDGLLTAKKGYAWDGPSGPTHDDKYNLVPSLHHDIGYQAIRMELLPLSCKGFFDDLLRQEMLDRGTPLWRAEMYHDGVMLFGGSSCEPGSDNDDVREVI